jgi:acyl carrier protein
MSNREKLLRAVADVFDIDPTTLDESSGQHSVPNWDSLGTVTLVAELEQVFGVEFDVLEIVEFWNIGSIKGALEKRGVAF